MPTPVEESEDNESLKIATASLSATPTSIASPLVPSPPLLPDPALSTLIAIADAFLPSLPPPSTSPPRQHKIARDAINDTAAAAAAAAAAATSQTEESLRRFWSHSLNINDRHQTNASSSSSAAFVESISTAVLYKLPPPESFKLTTLLRTLSNPVGTALLLCHPYGLLIRKGFHQWDLCDRVWALQRWRDSPLSVHREIYSGLKKLLCGIALSYVVQLPHDAAAGATDTSSSSGPNPQLLNPYWEAMGYHGPIHQTLTPDEDQKLIREGYPYEFDKQEGSEDEVKDGAMLRVTEDSVLQFDVVVIGSGSGGGVAAATLSGAGYSVLVLEKGPHIPPQQMNNLEAEMFDRQYEQHSLLTTADSNISIFAGSTLGGGSAINWGCCLDTPRHVREEWANCHGLEQFRPRPANSEGDSNDGDVASEFDHSLGAVKQRLGVTNNSSSDATEPSVYHNAMNTKFIRGCDALGYDCAPTGQNILYPMLDSAGYTCFGDRYGNKQSGLVTYLRDAAENGAKILTGCTVEQILHDNNRQPKFNVRASSPQKMSATTTGARGAAAGATSVSRSSDRRRAFGVIGLVEGEHRVHVLAKRCVICAAGSLHTPCVLLRSGFKNLHIGRHVRLHPVTCAVGLYDDDVACDVVNQEGVNTGNRNDGERSAAETTATTASSSKGVVNGWLGAPMTAVCNAFVRGPRDDGYGAKLECPCIHSGLAAVGLPWRDPIDFKRLLLRARDAVTLIVLQRDVSEGRVTLSRGDGGMRPIVTYALAEDDKRSMLQSLQGAVRILAASGASYLLTGHNDDKGLHLEEGDDDDGDANKGTTGRDNNSSEVEGHRREAAIASYTRSIESRGVPKHIMSVFSAHQMGSCRMGSSSQHSAIDPNGELWECDDLFVLDASTFPTASAANPMLTTLAISHMVSSRIALRLQYEDGRLSGCPNKADKIEKARRMLRDRDEMRSSSAGSSSNPVPSLMRSPWVALFVVTGGTAMLLAKYDVGKWLR